METKNSNAVKSAKIISFFTLISRILGYLRSLALAFAFGTGMIADSFFVAFRIPNTFRRLLGEGALSSGFIPIFSDISINKGKEEAFSFANKLFSCVGLILIIFTIFIYFFAPFIIRIIAPGFSLHPEKLATATLLLRYLFPYLFFMVLSALAMGILNSFKHFTLPAFSPILFNISFITSILFVSPYLKEPVYAIIAGVLIGGVLQFIVHIIGLKKYNFSFAFDLDFKHPLLIKIVKLIIPSIFALAITEINFFINNIIASYEPLAGSGAISALFYANFLVQLPLAIFATSIATAFFPEMAEHAARHDLSSLRETVTNAVRISFFIVMPACIGLLTLAHPITRLLYQHGKFTSLSTQNTAQALIAYSIGLVAFAGNRIIIPVFHSLSDTKTPMRVGVLSVIFNIIFSIILIFPLHHVGLALAASLSGFVNFGLLIYHLDKKFASLDTNIILRSSGKTILISLFMGIAARAVFVISNIYLMQDHLKSQIISVGFSILTGLLFYLGMAYILKCQELSWLVKFKIRNKG